MSTDVILLVDDSADDVFLTLRAFERSGIHREQIVVARDGAQALDLLLPSDGSNPLRPVVVLLDLNMPKIGGLEVLARLRADPATRTPPVIFLTSSEHERDVASSYDTGANSYVRKPVATDEFLAAATTLGVYWLDLNTRPRTPRPKTARDFLRSPSGYVTKAGSCRATPAISHVTGNRYRLAGTDKSARNCPRPAICSLNYRDEIHIPSCSIDRRDCAMPT